MDSHSRSASPREQPRPQQKPPSPPSPRLPTAAFDNRAYQHDEADPNHNDSFTSNGAHQNGHNKEPNGESKTLEAVNLELINLTPKNGSLKKKDVEVDMNGSNPYDEYFVPVNEHRKYMRGEKLYVTADKRGEKGGCKRPLCWTLLALVVAAIIALIALAATGVIFSNTPTPVEPYNVSISSARALPGIGAHDVQANEHDQHDENQGLHDLSHDQHNENDLNQNRDHEHDHTHEDGHQQIDLSNQGQEQNQETTEINQESHEHELNPIQDHENDHSQDQEIRSPETQSDEGQHVVIPGTIDTSMYVPKTVEGELKIDNEIFLEEYEDPESDIYRQFTDNFKEALLRALFDRNTLEAGNNDIKLEVIQLRPGSVRVTYRINWKPRFEGVPTEDPLNATTLEENLNNYLANNNRMISIYHVAENDMATRPVLDLCQINKNDCQYGCEFDETSLDFICTCPQGLILDMRNLKMCEAFIPAAPVHEINPEVNKQTSVSSTLTPEKVQYGEQDNGFDWKEIQAETTTAPDLDNKFLNTLDKTVNTKWNLEPTFEQNSPPSSEPESATNRRPESKLQPESEGEEEYDPETQQTTAPAFKETENKTNFDINTNPQQQSELNDQRSFSNSKEMSELTPVTESTIALQEPKPDEEHKEENSTVSHLTSEPVAAFGFNKMFEHNTAKPRDHVTIVSQYDSDSELQSHHSSDTAINFDSVLKSHTEIKPEEVYTEQTLLTSPPDYDNESKNENISVTELEKVPKANDSLDEHSENTKIMLDMHPAVQEQMPSSDFQETNIDESGNFSEIAKKTATTTELNSSSETIPEIISQEIGIDVTNSNTKRIENKTTTDDVDDWLQDTSAVDSKTSKETPSDTVTEKNPNLIPEYSILNDTATPYETESRAFKTAGNEFDPSHTSNSNVDINTLLGILNAEKNETKQSDTVETPGTISNGQTFSDIMNPNTEEYRNDSNLYNEQKEINYTIPSVVSESKVPLVNEIQKHEENITENIMSQDSFKATESSDETHPKEMLSNMSISDDGKYVTFDDINMLLNRSSKSMENLTQDNTSEISNNKTTELENDDVKPIEPEWVSEPVTEVNYNDGSNNMEKIETTESMKTKVDQIMSHAKDDYEPDYLGKADDSMYMMAHDYDSEDPRVKRVNTETGKQANDNLTEINSIVTVSTTSSSMPITTTSAPFTTMISAAAIDVSSSTVQSTTVSEFIYNSAVNTTNEINLIPQESNNITTLSTPTPLLSTEPTLILAESDNKYDSSTAKSSTAIASEINEGISETTTTPIVATLNGINENLNTTEVLNNNNQNGTQLNNLDVTIYEISHNTANHSSTISKTTINPLSEYEDHEIEMNPFLPETENNKNLVKKLQEGHDLELTSMNDTQNESSDEHNLSNVEGHIMTLNESSSAARNDSELSNVIMSLEEHPLEKSQSDDSPSLKKSEILESTDINKVLQDDKGNEESGREVLPISTFLIDTDDLDASKRFNTNTPPIPVIDSSMSSFTGSNNEDLMVVPINRNTAEENVTRRNAKSDNRYEINDISDTGKSSDKRTFDVAKYDTFTNNES